jgi:hypothetical protein
MVHINKPKFASIRTCMHEVRFSQAIDPISYWMVHINKPKFASIRICMHEVRFSQAIDPIS